MVIPANIFLWMIRGCDYEENLIRNQGQFELVDSQYWNQIMFAAITRLVALNGSEGSKNI